MTENIFEKIPSELPEELIDVIHDSDRIKIERIVSRGHASLENYWYDQDENEFVLVLQGSAGLKFKDQEEVQVLKKGDYLNINAHQKHRVEWTDDGVDTIWLAVFY